MAQRKLTAALLEPELGFTSSRSGGPGGQHANKVSSKVTLRFDVRGSRLLTDGEKEIIQKKLASRINADGILLISSQESRSQYQNRDAAVERFEALLGQAFRKRKPRKATKPSKASKEKRLKRKKHHAEKKRQRRNPPD